MKHNFFDALKQESPLQIVGAINAYSAMLAAHSGFGAIYLSGAGVANASFGKPDLGVTTLGNVAEDAQRICGATDLPLLVDVDTGWGDAAATIRTIERAGAAGMHIEDQIEAKRCGHRDGKAIVPLAEMLDRIKAAVDARTDEKFMVMARTDALAVEGLQAAIDRAGAFAQAGADAIFAEAMTELSHYQSFKKAAPVPLLANITEFGKTDLYTTSQLKEVGVDMVLYPLSAFRAMSKAALEVYGAIRRDGCQKAVVPLMQTRAELYEHLDYLRFEAELDRKVAGN